MKSFINVVASDDLVSSPCLDLEDKGSHSSTAISLELQKQCFSFWKLSFSISKMGIVTLSGFIY